MMSLPVMNAMERRRQIVHWLESQGSATVADLANRFRVAEVTLRKDLDQLATEGVVAKEHGGVSLKVRPQDCLVFRRDRTERARQKEAIGRAAAAMVKDSESIIIDSGSTTAALARSIPATLRLTVITTSLAVAVHAGARPAVEVHLSGGELKTADRSVTGTQVTEYFTRVHADRLFFSATGVSLQRGITYPEIGDVTLRRAMIGAADHVVLLADSSKFDAEGFATLGALELVHTLITDAGLPAEIRREVERRGLRVVIAD